MSKFLPVKNAPVDTILPERKTDDSAGYDFYLPCDVVIKPNGCTKIIPTNVKVMLNKGEYLALHIRSSIGIKRGVVLRNGTGIIDRDYAGNPENDGNIGICLQNNSNRWQRFHKGDRIMQGIIENYKTVANDAAVGKRKGGTGSTGK